jgi:hypothetical protein
MLPETEKVKGGMHQQVIDKLLEVPTSSLKKHSNKKELKTIAVLLLQSKDLRTKADYNLEENIDPREAEQHLRNTKKILSRSENVYNSMTQKVLSA